MRAWMILASLVLAAPAAAKVVTKTVEYKQGEQVLEGFLAYDDAAKGKRPGILVVHEWMGISDHTRKAAEDLAKMGYVAFAADIYGKGIRPTDPKAAGEQAGKFKNDRALLRARAQAGLDTLKQQKDVDPNKLAAIGFCFGGTTALELARAGAPLKATVSFHGGLDSPTPADAKNIKGKVLALHGADDPFVGPDVVAAFEKEMRDAGVDWQIVKFGGTVHSFTNPASGTDNSKGAAYNARSAKRAWDDMQALFQEAFKG
jgi:dienelactone hydrolase